LTFGAGSLQAIYRPAAALWRLAVVLITNKPQPHRKIGNIRVNKSTPIPGKGRR
jgi:hypothetical protein